MTEHYDAMKDDPNAQPFGPGITINPGAGPLPDRLKPTAVSAGNCMKQFVADLQRIGVSPCTFERNPSADDGEGRFGFLLRYAMQESEIEMPGLPVDQVRYMGGHQNIFHYPRLYVNGSSWVWSIALEIVKEDFGVTEGRPEQ